jgi:hypothetical protein
VSPFALSQIVTGRIRRTHPTVSPDRPLGTIQVQCDVSIDSRIPLLDCVQAKMHVSPALAAAAPMPSSGAHVIWQNVRWCGTAAIGGFTYLCALSGEANVERSVPALHGMNPADHSAGRYFFSVTQTRSIGFLPMFRDWCPTLISIVGIQPASPSGEGPGSGRSGSLYVFAAH